MNWRMAIGAALGQDQIGDLVLDFQMLRWDFPPSVNMALPHDTQIATAVNQFTVAHDGHDGENATALEHGANRLDASLASVHATPAKTGLYRSWKRRGQCTRARWQDFVSVACRRATA